VKTDSYSRISISEQEAFTALYTGKIDNLEGVVLDGNGIDQYNRARSINADRIPELEPYKDLLNISIEEFDQENQRNWFMPREDVQENLIEMLFGMCKTPEQRSRVEAELELFAQHGMIDLLFYLKYLVDTMRENKIIWGVGRGSSVASYVLYLIGVHKIDSIKYDLDIHEFLKEKQNGL
jgi:DNA polymerase III alpha subunit